MQWVCDLVLVFGCCLLHFSAWVCNSCSGEPGSPRREYHILKLCYSSSISLRWGNLVLGNILSRLGEWVSPKREPVSVISGLVVRLAQVGLTVLSESESHPGEGLSPKREIED